MTEPVVPTPRCDHCNREMVLLWACDDKHPIVYRLTSAAEWAAVARPALPAPEPSLLRQNRDGKEGEPCHDDRSPSMRGWGDANPQSERPEQAQRTDVAQNATGKPLSGESLETESSASASAGIAATSGFSSCGDRASLPAEHAPPDLPRVDADGCYTLPDGSCAGCPHCPHNSPTIGTSTKDDLDLALEAMSDAEVMAWASVIAAAVRDTTGWTSHIAWSIRRAVQGLKKRNTGGSRPALAGSALTKLLLDTAWEHTAAGPCWCDRDGPLHSERCQRIQAAFVESGQALGAKP